MHPLDEVANPQQLHRLHPHRPAHQDEIRQIQPPLRPLVMDTKLWERPTALPCWVWFRPSFDKLRMSGRRLAGEDEELA